MVGRGQTLLRILMIEDNPDDQILIQKTLDRAACYVFRFTLASTLSDALGAHQWQQFDLVILDLDLPDSPRQHTLNWLKNTPPPVPVVVMTGHDDESMAVKSIRAGAQDYLIKGGFDAVTGLRTIRYALERHRLIQELQAARDQSWYLSHHDPLTGLPNRQLFYERLEQSLSAVTTNQTRFAVLFIDLDRFKSINDSLGHDVGDCLLQSVAGRLKSSLPDSAPLSRLSSDEFAALLTLQRTEDAAAVANTVIEILTRPFEIGDRTLIIGASIGVALYPFDGNRAEELLRFADLAMFKAKSAGGNCYQFYHSQLGDEARQRLTLEHNLRRALHNDELTLYYQPLLNLMSGRVDTVEALVRWQHPERGLLCPGVFIPLAEQTGLILELDRWVLRQACQQNRCWQQQGLPPIRVAVNISARHFGRTDLVELIDEVLQETGLEPQWLEIELTESALMTEPAEASRMLGQLKSMGVHIAIDDFGMGYSSLSYLENLPAHTLKIDRTFLQNVPADGKKAALVMAIITLAKTLGLEVVAEGIEQPDQLRWLCENTCERAQGYLLAYPQPEPDWSHLPRLPTPLSV